MSSTATAVRQQWSSAADSGAVEIPVNKICHLGKQDRTKKQTTPPPKKTKQKPTHQKNPGAGKNQNTLGVY